MTPAFDPPDATLRSASMKGTSVDRELRRMLGVKQSRRQSHKTILGQGQIL
ncbi:hypothetical protein T190_07305 [Sinorhizobium meliloti CCBAU 01290]|nr:hypothetical protein T190_07305 [Sinorhizobium meliloti CCBAU 01290]